MNFYKFFFLWFAVVMYASLVLYAMAEGDLVFMVVAFIIFISSMFGIYACLLGLGRLWKLEEEIANGKRIDDNCPSG